MKKMFLAFLMATTVSSPLLANTIVCQGEGSDNYTYRMYVTWDRWANTYDVSIFGKKGSFTGGDLNKIETGSKKPIFSAEQLPVKFIKAGSIVDVNDFKLKEQTSGGDFNVPNGDSSETSYARKANIEFLKDGVWTTATMGCR